MRLRLVNLQTADSERELNGDSIVIGRSPSCELVLPDPLLSRRHARLFRRDERWYLEDLGSRNGTRLNGRALADATELEVGDVIEVSGCHVEIVDLGERSASPISQSESQQTVFLRSATELLDAAELAGEVRADLAEDELRKVSERLALINRFYQALGRAGDSESLLESMLDLVFEYFHADAGAIFLRREGGAFEMVASRPIGPQVEELLSSRTLIREVAEGGMAALVLDTASDERFSEAKSLVDAGLRSFLAAPLQSGEAPLGMVIVASQSAARQFGEEDLELLNSLAALSASRVRNLRLTREAAEASKLRQELKAARAIQVRLLPPVLPELPGYDLEAANMASSGVSGDFYQVVERKAEGECVILLADVSSKGMAAALLAAMLDSFAAEPMAQGREPEDVFRRLNDLLEERALPEWFATAYLARLRGAAGTLRYASAGHNPALLIRVDGSVEQLGKTGLPLGVMRGVSYRGIDVLLGVGDCLVLYTDGITEAFNAAKEEYGLERLIAVCVRQHGESASAMLAGIMKDVERFSGGEPRADDQTLVILRRSR